MPYNIQDAERKTFTSKGTRKKPNVSKKKNDLPDTKTITSINFFKERPESRRNAHVLNDNFDRPVTSKKRTDVGKKAVVGKEDSMFCIDEELLSDD